MRRRSDGGRTDVGRVIVTDDYYPYRYPLPARYNADIMASETERWATLADIGIASRGPDDTPLKAWRDAVAVASGIGDGFDPADGRPLDLGFSPMAVRQFVFYLA
jgi:hypothetical protein